MVHGSFFVAIIDHKMCAEIIYEGKQRKDQIKKVSPKAERDINIHPQQSNTIQIITRRCNQKK